MEGPGSPVGLRFPEGSAGSGVPLAGDFTPKAPLFRTPRLNPAILLGRLTGQGGQLVHPGMLRSLSFLSRCQSEYTPAIHKLEYLAALALALTTLVTFG